MYKTPVVSIILLGFNNLDYLLHCLECLYKQTYLLFDVILIDNGIAVESFVDLKASYPAVQIEHFSYNLGFAAANNIGARFARGKWIALLNADAYPDPDWLANLLQAAEKNPAYTAFSSRQIQYNTPHLLDGAGDAYHISGLAWRNSYNLPADKNGLEQKDVFSPCAAAALYSREEFLRLGGFDEDFFSYFEDVDLGFRLRLNGAKCLYVPEAIVHHVGSASTGKRSDFSVYYGYRNMIWTYFKNMPSPYFWLFLPLHFSTLLFFIVYLTLRGQGKSIWKAVFDALRGLPKMLDKRRMIQKNIRIAPKELLKVMSIGILEPYIEFINRNRGK